jgi:hypothetical protein
MVAFVAAYKGIESAGEVLENIPLNVALSVLLFEKGGDRISSQIGLGSYRAFLSKVYNRRLRVRSFVFFAFCKLKGVGRSGGRV